MLTREQERQIEIWHAMRPYASPDFEAFAYQHGLEVRALRRQEYAELKLFDPRAYQRLLEAKAEETRRRRGIEDVVYRPRSNLNEKDIAQIRRMHAAGARLAAIGRAFRVSVHSVSRIVRGKSFRGFEGPTRAPVSRGAHAPRGADHSRAKLTPELVARVLRMSGSLRAIGREVGLDKRTVQKIKAGGTWVQRATCSR